jgi:hypothetical protein
MPYLGMETGSGDPNTGVNFAKFSGGDRNANIPNHPNARHWATVALVGTVSYAFLGSISGLGTAGHAGAATRP